MCQLKWGCPECKGELSHIIMMTSVTTHSYAECGGEGQLVGTHEKEIVGPSVDTVGKCKVGHILLEEILL